MGFEKICFCVREHIAYLTLNTPQNLNAFTQEMSEEVLQALEMCKEDLQVHVVVISAQGKAFSGGGDIREMAEGIAQNKVIFDVTAEKIGQISLAMKQLPKPIITSVAGAVAGAAFNLVLAGDFCVAAENSKFVQAFVNIGLIPDAGGLFLLTRAVGVQKALHLAMLGTPVSAGEAKELGFVYEICSNQDLDSRTQALAQQLAAGPRVAYAKMKELLYISQFCGWKEYFPQEVAAQVACGYTDDYKEGVAAFLEKRPPHFQGK